MAQIDEVKAACARRAGMGWQSLLKQHGLDIAKADLAAELARKLAIDRSVPGVEDFSLEGTRGVEAGLPAASLLYHAFASPDVHPTASGDPATSADAYPTLAELDAVENYIYGLRPIDPARLKDFVIGVFAYEYRPGASTAHGYHADFVFSRTGIARVGTRSEAWDGQRRGFRGDPAGQSGIAGGIDRAPIGRRKAIANLVANVALRYRAIKIQHHNQTHRSASTSLATDCQ